MPGITIQIKNTLKCWSETHLADILHQCFVCADLSPLQSTHVLPDPGDEGELGPFAHGISCCDPHETKQTGIV